MLNVTPAPSVPVTSADLAEVRAMVADLATDMASVISAVAASRHRDGYEDGLAARDDQLAAARARRERARFQVLPGGAA